MENFILLKKQKQKRKKGKLMKHDETQTGNARAEPIAQHPIY
jgi:hypothetical protein